MQILLLIIKTNILIAHLRKASDKSKIAEQFCHPFLKEDIFFMHNGGINGKRWNIEGKIDSQILFEAIQNAKNLIEKEDGKWKKVKNRQ